MNSLYMNDKEVSELLGITIGRLRNKISAGCELPPRTKLPGCRQRLWPTEAVRDWLEKHVVDSELGAQ
jgi:predicted DNA-binding transcriptional regulator AlpA